MKLKTLCVSLLPLSLLLIYGCKSSEVRNNQENSTAIANTAVANVDRLIVPVIEFSELLDKAINEIANNEEYDNFILFIHGRGKHPTKAFEKKLISSLEEDYSSKVIMFHWGPSWKGPAAFPEKNARNSADDFGVVVNQLRKYRKNNPQLIKNIKFSLLTHSMGSIVLEQYLDKNVGSIDDLFDTVVISSSASRAKGHSKWANKIKIDDFYITVNEDDRMLKLAGTKMGGKRLGKALQSMSGNEFNLASNAKYIDVTDSPLGHRYYLHRDLEGSPVVKSFYNEVLNGSTATLQVDGNVEKIKRKQVYVLKGML